MKSKIKNKALKENDTLLRIFSQFNNFLIIYNLEWNSVFQFNPNYDPLAHLFKWKSNRNARASHFVNRKALKMQEMFILKMDLHEN